MIAIRHAEPSDAAELVALAAAVGREPGNWLLTTETWRPVADERRYLRAVRMLLDAAVAWARLAGVAKLELHVFPWNEPAIRLYERFGFEHEGLRRGHYLRDGVAVDALLMAYHLPSAPGFPPSRAP